MRAGRILHPELARGLATLGHTDVVLVTDAGFPIPAMATGSIQSCGVRERTHRWWCASILSVMAQPRSGRTASAMRRRRST